MYDLSTMLYDFLKEETIKTDNKSTSVDKQKTNQEPPVEENPSSYEGEEEVEPEDDSTTGEETEQDPEQEEQDFEDEDTGLGEEENSKPIFNLIPLKKLFIRLVIIDKMIKKINDPNLKIIRIYVNDSMELIKIISNNIDLYVDDFKKITKMYEKFILDVLSDIKKSVSKLNRRKTDG